MSKELSKQELANELQLIKARQLQLQKQVRDLGYAAARVTRQLHELPQEQPRADARTILR